MSRTYHEIVITRRGTDRRPRFAGSVRLEKVFDKYYTYYPHDIDPEYVGDTGFYFMVRESFDAVDDLHHASKIYDWRKPKKRHTFDTVRLFYEGMGIGLRREEDVK